MKLKLFCVIGKLDLIHANDNLDQNISEKTWLIVNASSTHQAKKTATAYFKKNECEYVTINGDSVSVKFDCILDVKEILADKLDPPFEVWSEYIDRAS